MTREKLDPTQRGLTGYQGFFLALTLIVMIILVLTTKELTTAILLIGLITNYLIISSQLTLLGDRHAAMSGKGGGGAFGKIDRDLGSSVMVNPTIMEGFGEPMTRRPPQNPVTHKCGNVEEDVFEGTRPPQATFNASHLNTPPRGERERFTGATTAPPGAGSPAFPNIPETTTLATYPGVVDFGETDHPVIDEAPALGHRDWDAAARDTVPEGNPYDHDRIANPQAAAPCVDDDAIAVYDGDELMVYQARSRNDPERVWAGIYRRKALVDRYVREELDERENTQWWGVGEV